MKPIGPKWMAVQRGLLLFCLFIFLCDCYYNGPVSHRGEGWERLRRSHAQASDNRDKDRTVDESGYFKLPGDDMDVFRSARRGRTGAVIESNVEKGIDVDMEKKVIRQMINACDHLPDSEVQAMYRRLSACTSKSSGENIIERQAIVQELVKLTRLADDIEEEVGNGGRNFDELSDAMRVLRSRIRMYTADAEFFDEDGNKVDKPALAIKNLFEWPWSKQ